jgi:hypothetical protein
VSRYYTDRSGRAVWGPLERWDRGFESHLARMPVCVHTVFALFCV